MEYSYSYGYSASMNPALLIPIVLIALIIGLLFYLFYGLCWWKIAKKTNTENAWFAFIPILNIVLMLQVVRRPVWWLLLCLVPLVNVIIILVLYMDVAETFGMSKWLGCIGVFFSPLMLVLLPYWAFSSVQAKPIERPTTTV